MTVNFYLTKEKNSKGNKLSTLTLMLQNKSTQIIGGEEVH